MGLAGISCEGTKPDLLGSIVEGIYMDEILLSLCSAISMDEFHPE